MDACEGECLAGGDLLVWVEGNAARSHESLELGGSEGDCCLCAAQNKEIVDVDDDPAREA
jgi:hypothetical protein